MKYEPNTRDLIGFGVHKDVWCLGGIFASMIPYYSNGRLSLYPSNLSRGSNSFHPHAGSPVFWFDCAGYAKNTTIPERHLDTLPVSMLMAPLGKSPVR